jgi:lysozyme
MRRIWIALLLLAACGGAAGLAALGLAEGWWRPANPDRARYPLWGIDVSHHQGAIDWATVAQEPNLVFAYLKASEGGDWRDPRFAENLQQARAAGLKVGAYHFFTFCRAPLEQAANFLEVAPRDSAALPPAVDVEFGGNCGARPTPEKLRRDLGIFVDAVAKALERRPIVYLTPEAHAGFFDSGEVGHPFWIRSLWGEPVPGWTFWQFANRARVRGIRTAVDLNAFHADERALLDAL